MHGVDMSPAMIASAKAEATEAHAGIVDYFIADASDTAAVEAAVPAGSFGTYDLVIACYLLHYAEDVATLRAFINTIARALKPGGVMAIQNNNPDAPLGPLDAFRVSSGAAARPPAHLPACIAARAHIRLRVRARLSLPPVCRSTATCARWRAMPSPSISWMNQATALSLSSTTYFPCAITWRPSRTPAWRLSRCTSRNWTRLPRPTRTCTMKCSSGGRT